MRKIPKYGSQEYWKGTKNYYFDMKGNKEILNVLAYDKRSAKIKARLHEKWLSKKGFNDKVLLNTIRSNK